ncbi:hypothetical protein ONA91_33745 [Micromonospora sp. DR5-3]|uniref:hypothetical protein n=1 Tax=unclassified Micromonospora TaxID=2617518 RepID=UPI0011D6663A|nr:MULTISPECIES: hypothetical protein [unclassified Micromonospora]MCW3819417.1 hypothetical protein [Micromonospora sp. DR5-3]TYC20796.1 hypothetical protein FXF52_29280 [Micromonospora sp. MP36]
MAGSQGEARMTNVQDRPDRDQHHDDQQWTRLQSILSDVWQNRLDFYGELIGKVSNDRYPSPTMLDTIESGLPPELYADYIAVLVDKVFDSKYPSPTLLARLGHLTNLSGQRG